MALIHTLCGYHRGVCAHLKQLIDPNNEKVRQMWIKGVQELKESYNELGKKEHKKWVDKFAQVEHRNEMTRDLYNKLVTEQATLQAHNNQLEQTVVDLTAKCKELTTKQEQMQKAHNAHMEHVQTSWQTVIQDCMLQQEQSFKKRLEELLNETVTQGVLDAKHMAQEAHSNTMATEQWKKTAEEKLVALELRIGNMEQQMGQVSLNNNNHFLAIRKKVADCESLWEDRWKGFLQSPHNNNGSGGNNHLLVADIQHTRAQAKALAGVVDEVNDRVQNLHEGFAIMADSIEELEEHFETDIFAIRGEVFQLNKAVRGLPPAQPNDDEVGISNDDDDHGEEYNLTTNTPTHVAPQDLPRQVFANSALDEEHNDFQNSLQSDPLYLTQPTHSPRPTTQPPIQPVMQPQQQIHPPQQPVHQPPQPAVQPPQPAVQPPQPAVQPPTSQHATPQPPPTATQQPPTFQGDFQTEDMDKHMTTLGGPGRLSIKSEPLDANDEFTGATTAARDSGQVEGHGLWLLCPTSTGILQVTI